MSGKRGKVVPKPLPKEEGKVPNEDAVVDGDRGTITVGEGGEVIDLRNEGGGDARGNLDHWQRRMAYDAIVRQGIDVARHMLIDGDVDGAVAVLSSTQRRLDRLEASA